MSEIQSHKRPRSDFDTEIELPTSAIEDPKKRKANFKKDEPAESYWELLTTRDGYEDEDEGSVESVLRRLAEASDDELGIPRSTTEEVAAEESWDVDLGMCSGLLWELEDEIANHYTLLHSDLFS